jgi:hypothetical protein
MSHDLLIIPRGLGSRWTVLMPLWVVQVAFIDLPDIVKGVLGVANKLFERVFTERFLITTSREWTEADDELKAYAAATAPERALHWDAQRVLHIDIEALIADRMAAEVERK